MTEREAFVRRICEEPDCDAHRLVFADWLDEKGGDPTGAAFLRWHVGNPGASHPPEEIGHWSHFLPTAAFWWNVCGDARRVAESMTNPPDPGYLAVGFDRGCVSAMWCGIGRFLANAKDWFRMCPITSVTLTGKRPAGPAGCDSLPEPGYHCRWYGSFDHDGMPAWLPHELLDAVARLDDPRKHPRLEFWYRTEFDALAVLSRACVAYGRDLVRLPPLPADPPQEAPQETSAEPHVPH